MSFEQHERIVEARLDESDMRAALGHREDGIGWPSPTEHRTSFYDLDSGALLAVISVLEQDELTLQLDAKKRVLHIVGPTCGGSVAFGGAARYAP